jgi:RNA polymerase sigma factor (sigma-70 family)
VSGPSTPFDDVVARYGATVFRVCRAVVGPTDAEDAWSDTFLAALRAYPRLAPDANLEAWLVTIAHRSALDIKRRSTRHAIPVADVPDRAEDDRGPFAEDRLDVWRAVAALPERQRCAIAYHYLMGLAFRDVAEIVGGSPDAARRAAHDGIITLRARFAPAHEQGGRQ